jgi:FAD/FMN-containing dehydrogenase
VYISEEKQADFMATVDALGDELKMRLAVFGRPEYNTFNVRPTYIPTSADGLKRMVAFIQKYLQIIKDFGGYCCGGSSEGRMMGAFVRATADKQVIELAKVIKDAFDPEGILNPGTKHEASPGAVFKHLRKEYSNTIQSIY